MRAAAAWTLFWLGDMVSKTIEPALGRWFEWPYLIYHRLMCWSDDIQGDGPGPWGPVSQAAADGEITKPRPYSSGCMASDIPGATCQKPKCDC